MNVVLVFIQKAIAQGIGILFGATGEIITEKSGNGLFVLSSYEL